MGEICRGISLEKRSPTYPPRGYGRHKHCSWSCPTPGHEEENAQHGEPHGLSSCDHYHPEFIPGQSRLTGGPSENNARFFGDITIINVPTEVQI